MGARDFNLANGVDYYRIETGKDFSADAVQLLDHIIGKAVSTILGSATAPALKNSLALIFGDDVLKERFLEFGSGTLKGVIEDLGGSFSDFAVDLNSFFGRIVDKKINGPTVEDISMAAHIFGSAPGKQINISTSDFVGYANELVNGGMHSIDEYISAIGKLNDISFWDDFNFSSNLRKITGYQTGDDYDYFDPIRIGPIADSNQNHLLSGAGSTMPSQQQYSTISNGVHLMGDNSAVVNIAQGIMSAASWVPGATGSIAGLFDPYREYFSAEKYSGNQVVIGSSLNDTLVGDNNVSGSGSDDLFYLGGGYDKVYGHQEPNWATGSVDDDGGIDTVVYDFNGIDIVGASISGDYSNDSDNGNKVNVNIDGSPDILWDIEQFHFIDNASSSSNLLAGTENVDLIDGLAGNDYLYGANGDDTLTGGAGNDRIHGGKGSDTAVFSGNYDQYLFSVADNSLRLENSATGEVDYLYSVESIKIGSADAVATSSIVWLGGAAFSDAPVYAEPLSSKLLAMYAPVWNYKDGDADNLNVYGHAVTEADGTISSLQYELREVDPIVNDHWYVELLLGKDLLPTAVASIVDTTQVRNVWDSELSFSGNHLNVFLDLDSEGVYLTRNIVNADKSFAPTTLSGASNYAIQTAGFESTDFYYRSNSDDDYDLTRSDNYVIDGNSNGVIKLAGLEGGQMEMGFLFAGTSLQDLGHYDLV